MRRLLDQMVDHIRGHSQVEKSLRELDDLAERVDTTREWYKLGVEPLTIEQFMAWIDSAEVHYDPKDSTVYIGGSTEEEPYIEVFFHESDGAHEVVYDTFVIGKDGLVMTNVEHIEMDRFIFDRIRRTHPQFARH